MLSLVAAFAVTALDLAPSTHTGPRAARLLAQAEPSSGQGGVPEAAPPPAPPPEPVTAPAPVTPERAAPLATPPASMHLLPPTDPHEGGVSLRDLLIGAGVELVVGAVDVASFFGIVILAWGNSSGSSGPPPWVTVGIVGLVVTLFATALGLPAIVAGLQYAFGDDELRSGSAWKAIGYGYLGALAVVLTGAVLLAVGAFNWTVSYALAGLVALAVVPTATSLGWHAAVERPKGPRLQHSPASAPATTPPPNAPPPGVSRGTEAPALASAWPPAVATPVLSLAF